MKNTISKQNFYDSREWQELYKRIRASEKLKQMEAFIQHGNVTCLEHCTAITFYSLYYSQRLNLKYDRQSLIIGAMLHDYFLYDWHESGGGHKLHGWKHPYTALKKASADFNLNNIERDIISKHMFPLTPFPPTHIESTVVCIIDKICSLRETFIRNPYGDMFKK